MTVSWSELNERRRAIRARWPTIWRLPVVKRSMRHAAAQVPQGAAVLDIGASEGRFGRRLAPGATYKTLDVDPQVGADYRSLGEVRDAAFDVAAAFETIEHVELEEAIQLLRGVARVLKPGGRLFLSTPNVHHPWAYLCSATHRTPFCYDELGGLIEHCGLVVDGLYRCHHDAALKGVLRLLAKPLYRVAGIDYARSILAIARRPAE